MTGKLRRVGLLTGCIFASAGTLPPAVAFTHPLASAALPDDPALGSVQGSVQDRDGDVLSGARVTFHPGAGGGDRTVVSGPGGEFALQGVPAGAFTLTVAAPGFAPVSTAGSLQPGEQLQVPVVVLVIATSSTDVQVKVTRQELATEEVAAEEKQRVLGVFPNFLVTYDREPVKLSPKQKLNLGWRTAFDPVNLGISAFVAGVQQADGAFAGYGGGASGYGKRLGADLADSTVGTLIGSAVLPVVFRQDPRYIYRGTGSTLSRAGYAVAMTVVARGDNGHWQPNYSNVLGSLAAGAISNLYYPAGDRDGAGVTVENGLVGVAEGGIFNLLQEFVVRHFTPHLPPKQ